MRPHLAVARGIEPLRRLITRITVFETDKHAGLASNCCLVRDQGVEPWLHGLEGQRTPPYHALSGELDRICTRVAAGCSRAPIYSVTSSNWCGYSGSNRTEVLWRSPLSHDRIRMKT